MTDAYLPPFAAWKNISKVVDEDSNLYVKFEYEAFIRSIKMMLCSVKIDEAFYLATYPDVADAIKSGVYRDAAHHFVANGYFEGRLPFKIAVDEKWYLKENPDVKAGIKDGKLESVEKHFNDHGYGEGRLPSNIAFE